MSNTYEIVFKPEECIQCHGCEIACQSWRKTEPKVKLRKVISVWHDNDSHVKIEPVSAACVHCAEPECVPACPASAIQKRETDGLVLVNEKKCTGCQACLDACPYKIPQFDNDGIMKKCDMCFDQIDLDTMLPPCVATCPSEALVLSRVP